MKILLINRNNQLLMRLSQVLIASGHRVTLAILVNEAHENLGMSFCRLEKIAITPARLTISI